LNDRLQGVAVKQKGVRTVECRIVVHAGSPSDAGVASLLTAKPPENLVKEFVGPGSGKLLENPIVSDAQKAALSPEVVLQEMKKNGVTHVVWLPDSETNWLYLLMKAEPSLTLVGVNREGLAFSAASGIAAGGKTPLILIQNTGLMESGDSLRGWTLGMNVPVVLMVGYRGWTRHGVNTDTAATYTERFLNAFGIQYYLVEDGADAGRISIAFEEAKKTRRPVAVLVADEYHGFN